MLKLLREHEVAPHFRRLTRKRTPTVIAVPFWGEGAIARLGLETGDDARIICNLSSRACNPYVIGELKRLFGSRVRTNPKLHAKLYATENACIVGSSNASTNGLTVEGDALTGWIEANVLSDETLLVSAALEMFESVWADHGTVKISAPSLKEAIAAWEARPRDSAVRAKTLLAACRESPALFGNVYVAAFDNPLGKDARSKLTNLKRDSVAPPDHKALDFRNAWGYQYEDAVPAASWLLDLDCRNPTNIKLIGCSWTGDRVLRLKIRGEPDLTITHPGSVRIGPTSRRFILSLEEKNALKANAAAILARTATSVLPLVQAVRIIDGGRRRKRR